MIHLNFSYTKDEFLSALRTYLLHKPNFIALSIIVYLLFLSLLLVLLGGGFDFATTWFAVSSIVALFGLVGLMLFALPHHRLQRSHIAIDEYWFHIGEEGIIYETDHENGVLPWRKCTKLLERKSLYVFEHDGRRITVIPKRAFKNKNDERAFREILKSKLTPALSSKLLKEKDAELIADYAPPAKMPDWR